jgi:hypothetical protein
MKESTCESTHPHGTISIVVAPLLRLDLVGVISIAYVNGTMNGINERVIAELVRRDKPA